MIVLSNLLNKLGEFLLGLKAASDVRREAEVMLTTSRSYGILALIAAGLLTSGCFPMKGPRVAAVALTVQDVADAAAKGTDVALVREGTPAYLMLMDGLLEAYPENRDLLIAASRAYGSYAATLDGEPARALAINRKALDYGLRALSVGRADFREKATGNIEELRAHLQGFTSKDVPALFWTASAWAGWISQSSGSVEAMADLPAFEAILQRTIELDESFYHGGPHLLKGIYLAAKPQVAGGDLASAKTHFDRAFALGSDKILMARVYYAQYYATGMKDKDLYTRTLRDVLEAKVDEPPEMSLANTMAQQRARQLLDETEATFEEAL
jgi:hypothetical protein